MPLQKRLATEYHGTPEGARKPKILGKQALLARFSWVSESLLSRVSRSFPVAVTEHWANQVEPSPRDPLLLQVLPDPRELIPAGGDLSDPVADAAMSPVPWLVQKHPDRALLLVTKRCHVYCRYCFRRDHSPGDRLDPTEEELSHAIATAQQSGARELILSGGDPLSLGDSPLQELLGRVRPLFPVLRIHTRAPVTAPARITEGLVAVLRAHDPIWMVIHANHPRELSPPVVAALDRLRDAGIPLLNQSVLLRGVNDDTDVLVELSERLVELGVVPYYLHHTDPVPGNAHLRVSVKEGEILYHGMRKRLSGIALPNYVVDLPSGHGKIPVEEAHRNGMIR